MSGKFHSALDALAALSVPGVNHNYTIGAIPERLTRASLPLLLTLPLLDGEGLRKHSEFAILTPSGAVGVAEYYVTHLLLYVPTGQNRNVASSLPALADLIDSYATTIRQNSTLGGTLYQPLSYYALPGDVTWGGMTYLGVRFVLRMVVEV